MTTLIIGGVYTVLDIHDNPVTLHIVSADSAVVLTPEKWNGYTWHTTELFNPQFVRFQDITAAEARQARIQECADAAAMFGADEWRTVIETDVNGKTRELRTWGEQP